MAKTLKDLVMALLNATLILIALCLFLGWKLVSTIDDVTDDLAGTVQEFLPIGQEIQGIRADLTGLRSDLARTGNTVDSASRQRLDAVLTKLETLENGLQSAQLRFAELADSPELLVDHALQTAGDVVTEQIIILRSCVPAS